MTTVVPARGFRMTTKPSPDASTEPATWTVSPFTPSSVTNDLLVRVLATGDLDAGRDRVQERWKH